MNKSSLMLAIFHLKRDSTRRNHFPPLPWPQDDGDDSLIFTAIISPAINASSPSRFSHPCLLLQLTRSCWEHTEHPSPRSLESRRAEAQIKARHVSDRSPPRPNALPKNPAPGPGGKGGRRSWANRARRPGRRVLALVLLEGDVTDPLGCGSPGPTFGCSLCSLHAVVRTGERSKKAWATLAARLLGWALNHAPWLYLGEKWPAGESATSIVSCDSTSIPFARGKHSPFLHWQREMGDRLFCRMHGIVPG